MRSQIGAELLKGHWQIGAGALAHRVVVGLDFLQVVVRVMGLGDSRLGVGLELGLSGVELCNGSSGV